MKLFAWIHSSRIWAHLSQRHIHMPNVPREINTKVCVHVRVCVCVCARTHRCTHRNPFLFSKCLETQPKTQGLGFTSVPFYVCGLAGKNHLSPAAAKSSQQGPAFMLPHAAQPKTISTIQTLSAESTSWRHWDMVCEHQRPFLTKK